MPFTRILTRLINSVHDATCAIIMDVDCEYVQFAGNVDPYKQKLMGAYQGIILGQTRQICLKQGAFPPEKLITEYKNACFVTLSLRSDYFLVLAMESTGNIGQGLRAIEVAGREINAEID